MRQYTAQVRVNGTLTETTREGLVNTFSWVTAVINTGGMDVTSAVVLGDSEVIASYNPKNRTWYFN